MGEIDSASSSCSNWDELSDGVLDLTTAILIEGSPQQKPNETGRTQNTTLGTYEALIWFVTGISVVAFISPRSLELSLS